MPRIPERDLWFETKGAEFAGWAEAQGYCEGQAFDFEDLHEAFTEGMEALRALTAVAPVRGDRATPYTSAQLEAAIKAIMTAQNANDDEPERFEARVIATAALNAVHRLRTAVPPIAEAPKAAPEFEVVGRNPFDGTDYPLGSPAGARAAFPDHGQALVFARKRIAELSRLRRITGGGMQDQAWIIHPGGRRERVFSYR